MAEGGSRGKVLCRFYAINTCYKGENCPYSHDRALLDSLGHSSSQTSVNIPCKYFAAGSCNRGSDCRFSHDSALPPPQIEQIPNFTVPAQWPGNMQIRYAHIDPLQLNMGQAPVRYVTNQPQRTLLMPGNPAMNIRGPAAAVQGPVAPEASLSAKLRMTLWPICHKETRGINYRYWSDVAFKIIVHCKSEDSNGIDWVARKLNVRILSEVAVSYSSSLFLLM